MTKHTRRGEKIMAFLLKQAPRHPKDLARVACENFGITRQAVSRYLNELEATGALVAIGNTSQRQYSIRVILKEMFSFNLDGLEEDVVWRDRIAPFLGDLPMNALSVWQYCVSEMVNNAIDHSGGSQVVICLERTAISTEIIVRDNGVGIFRKIKEECHLEDERHAVLELAKGKLTTDPKRHTGEGIFFTSRMLFDFAILSGDVCFTHKHGEDEDWISKRDKPDSGTSVFMILSNNATITTKEVFDDFASYEHDHDFTKTIVPVRLAQHGTEQLVSRSQAKRLLASIDRFNVVILDFIAVETIGQSFADEIFRVFERSHPNIKLVAIHASPPVEKMIKKARSIPQVNEV